MKSKDGMEYRNSDMDSLLYKKEIMHGILSGPEHTQVCSHISELLLALRKYGNFAASVSLRMLAHVA